MVKEKYTSSCAIKTKVKKREGIYQKDMDPWRETVYFFVQRFLGTYSITAENFITGKNKSK